MPHNFNLPQNASYTKEQLEQLRRAMVSNPAPLTPPVVYPPGFSSPQGPKPISASADFLTRIGDFVSTIKGYPDDEAAILLFAAQHVPGKETTDRCVCYASGIGHMLLNALGHGLERYEDVNSIVTGAWVQHFLDSTVRTTDRDKLILRKALIRVSGVSAQGQQVEKSPADEVADIIAEVAAEHPDRQQRITPSRLMPSVIARQVSLTSA